MKTLWSRTAFILSLAFTAASPVHADIVGVSASILVIAPPSTVVGGELESDKLMFLFAERTTFTLTAPVLVDVTAAPTSVDLPSGLTPAIVPAGTLVDSYYLHHDQVGMAQNFNKGAITFDSDVVGIVVRTESLVSSNGQLGAPDTSYNAAPDNQGLELIGSCDTTAGSQDRVTVSADRRTVTLCTNVYGFPDDIRILTKGRIPVVIDIKPGSFPNSINPRSRGRTPVAVLGDSGIDVTQVDVATLRFAGASASHAALEDVNGDGATDLIAHFDTPSTNLNAGDTTACVTGNLVEGTPFRGCDSVNIVK